MYSIKLFFVILFFSYYFKYFAAEEKSIALLPVISNGVDLASAQTAESMLRLELNKQNSLTLLSEKRTYEIVGDEICTEEECAIKIGKKLDVKEVLICKLNVLGEKIIVQYILVDVDSGKDILIEQTTALNLDDLEPVMKRIAISVARETPFSANTEVGNIVGNESVEELRRTSKYNFGIGFGYLFPTHGYDNDDKSITINAYFDHEIDDFAVGLLAGARDGFALNLYGAYLFSRTDVCPYLGGSIGFHWIKHNFFENIIYDEVGNYTSTTNKPSGDGIELGIKTGVRILHTFNVQLFINFEYIMTFNDYNDRSFVFTIGIL